MEPKVITVSDTFHCAECKRKLVEVRERATDIGFDLRCPRCDKELLESGK